MLGPVLYQEMKLGGRRGRTHVFRWLYVLWLLGELFLWSVYAFMFAAMAHERAPNFSDLADLGRSLCGLLVPQHFLVLALATPVMVAGAITDEKARGTLQYLLTTDLFPSEILVGKLVARCYQVFLLLLPALPPILVLGAFAGMTPAMVFAFALDTALLIFGIGAASLLASVWSRHARQAVLLLLTLGVVVQLVSAWLEGLADPDTQPFLHAVLGGFNPVAPLGPDWLLLGDEAVWRRVAAAAIVWGGLGCLSLGVAAWRLRPAYVKQMQGEGRARRFSLWGVRRPLKGDPILWKERQVEGIAPLNFLRRVPRWLGVVAVFVLSTVSSLAILADCLPMGTTPGMVWEMVLALDLDGLSRVAAGMAPSSGRFYTQGTVVVFVGSLLVGIRCSGAITGERERQTWEALLMTPLTTQQLVRNKLWGILGAALPYFLAYAVPALLLSVLGGPGALLATALSVAIALLALLYVAGAGLWCTSRALTSWRSLLGTLGFTYVGGFVLVLATAFLAIFVWLFIIMAMAILDALLQRLGASTSLMRGAAGISFDAYRVAFCIVLAAFFLGLSVWLIKTAETPVVNRERARHWKPRPRYRRRERW